MKITEQIRKYIAERNSARKISRTHFRFQPRSIRFSLILSYTAASFLIVMIMGLSVASLYEARTKKALIENATKVTRQQELNLEEYMTSLRNISDAVYYNIIPNSDTESDSLDKDLKLLYNATSNRIVSMAVFKEDGTIIASTPYTSQRDGIDITSMDWFRDALNKKSGMVLSTPHVQNIFYTDSYRYPWVITLSMSVNLREKGEFVPGVLLIDMNYENLEYLLEQGNGENSDIYSYLEDAEGNLIYHPHQNKINIGLAKENNLAAASYKDGTYTEDFNGEKRTVLVDTLTYTGWKLVTVIPDNTVALGTRSFRGILIMITSLLLIIVVTINRMIAERISRPLIRLNNAISHMDDSRELPEGVYDSGSKEVQELGQTLKGYLAQINGLMEDIVHEEEEKRESELDALQAQINPHFLYNTLDSIVWMIEGEKYKEAVFMITQLASLFRISLNKGKAIIPISQEIKHASAYLNIQKVRYKDSFTAFYDIEEDVENCLTVKLVIQPILENAIYHGIKEAEQDGEIHIRGRRLGNDIYITVQDNGYGMSPQEIHDILQESKRPATEKHGSGVGLINVHNRLRLRFGEQYGLKIESEYDIGTTVTIHIPAIEATPENLEKYEHRKGDNQ